MVPVYLGNMDLNRTYYLDVGVRIIHMLYMAWGGECLYYNTLSIPHAVFEKEKQRLFEEIIRLNILHNDI